MYLHEHRGSTVYCVVPCKAHRRLRRMLERRPAAAPLGRARVAHYVVTPEGVLERHVVLAEGVQHAIGVTVQHLASVEHRPQSWGRITTGD